MRNGWLISRFQSRKDPRRRQVNRKIQRTCLIPLDFPQTIRITQAPMVIDHIHNNLCRRSETFSAVYLLAKMMTYWEIYSNRYVIWKHCLLSPPGKPGPASDACTHRITLQIPVFWRQLVPIGFSKSTVRHDIYSRQRNLANVCCN